MDKRTLTALQGSIAKWQAIEDGEAADLGPANCPLCALFMRPENSTADCVGCPVSEAVAAAGCSHTPYIPWSRASRERNYFADTPELVALARTERIFLESLLPPGGVADES
jgi:hypothetical protein